MTLPSLEAEHHKEAAGTAVAGRYCSLDYESQLILLYLWEQDCKIEMEEARGVKMRQPWAQTLFGEEMQTRAVNGDEAGSLLRLTTCYKKPVQTPTLPRASYVAAE